MNLVKLLISTDIFRINHFINLVNEQDYMITVFKNKYKVNANSVMGLLSMDLDTPVEVLISDETKIEEFKETFKEFLV